MGEDKLVVMLGGLHIELAVLKAIGSWLLGSGWTEAVAQAGITTTGRAESLVTSAHITRTRYVRQITASSLYILQQRAYKNYYAECAENAPPFPEWRKDQAGKIPLLRCMVAGPELARMVKEFETTVEEDNTTQTCTTDHEQSRAFQARFISHIQSLVLTIEELGNPLEEESTCTDLISLVSRNWQEFLRLDNKKVVKMVIEGKQIKVSKGEEVLCSPPATRKNKLSPCSHEEADTRMMVHITDAVQDGHQSVMTRSTRH